MNDPQRADDRKRSEVLSFKCTERMALDILRLAAADDRSLSDYLYGRLRRVLYGEIAKLADPGQSTSAD